MPPKNEIPHNLQVRLIEMQRSNPIYKYVFNKYLSSTQKKNLKKIEKIFCPVLFSRYQLKRDQRKKRGFKYFEKRLMLVVDVKSIKSIMRSSSKWRTLRCYKLKAGVVFATNADLADKTATWNVGKNRAMIIADVLVEKPDLGGYCTEVPPEGVATTPEDGRVCVKFYGDEFLPKFIVYYTYNENKV